jgi:hypothetical protein
VKLTNILKSVFLGTLKAEFIESAKHVEFKCIDIGQANAFWLFLKFIAVRQLL